MSALESEVQRFAGQFPAKLIKQAFIMQPEDAVLYSKYLVEYAILFPDQKSTLELDESSPSVFISNLFLSVNNREKLIEKLRTSMMADKTFPPDFFAITLIQSFCAVLLVDIETISVASVVKFVDCFEFGVKCLPQCQQLCVDLLVYLIARVFSLKDVEKLKVLVPKVDEAASLFSHRLVHYSSLMFSCVVELIDVFEGNEDGELKRIIISHLKLVQDAVDWESLGSTTVFEKMKEQLLKFLGKVDPVNDELCCVFPVLSLLLHYVSEMNAAEVDSMSCKMHEFMKRAELVFQGETNDKPNTAEEAAVDGPGSQSLANLHVEKVWLGDYKVRPSGVPKFLMTNEVIRQFMEFLALSTLFHGEHLIEYLFKLGKNWILKGDLVFEAIILEYIWAEERYRKELCAFCDNNVFWHVIFNEYLFHSNVCIFNVSDQGADIMDLRSFVFDVMELLMHTTPKNTIFASLLLFINRIQADCALFTEVMFFISSKLKHLISADEEHFDMFVKLLANEIMIQQSRHLRGDVLAPRYRPILLEVIEGLNEIKGFSLCTFVSIDFLNSIFSLFFETDMFTLGFRLLQCLVDPYVSATENHFWDSFLKVINMSLSSVLKQAQKPDFTITAIHLCSVIQFFVSQDDRDILQQFAKSPSFDMFCKLLTVEKPTTENLDSQVLIIGFNVLTILCARKVIEYQDVPWMSFLPAVKRVKMTGNLLSALRVNVSMPDNPFSSLENPHAIQLLVFGTEGTECFHSVLESLCDICENSVWNCVSCFRSGVLFRLLDLFSSSVDQATSNLILKLFDAVNANISSKQLFCGLSRLLEPVDGKFLQPRFLEYAKVFELLLPKSSKRVHTFIHFSSESEGIKFRGLTQKEIQSSFTVSLWLLLDPFPTAHEAFSVLHCAGKNGMLHFFLTRESLWLSFQKNGKLILLHTMGMKTPTHSWFNLVLCFSMDKGLSVYLNGEVVGWVSDSVGFVQEYEYIHIMSSHADAHYPSHWMKNGQFSSCALFNGPFTETWPGQIFKAGPDAILFSRLSNSICAFYTAQRVKRTHLLNTIKNSPIGDAVFNGTMCSFVTSFLQVFELSNGVAFLSTLWSQLVLEYENGQKEPQLALILSSMFLTLIRVSDFAQVQMVQLDSYSIIAHFLTQADPSYLSAPLWKSFFAHFQSTNNEDLRNGIAQKVLFNYSIWSKMSITAAPEVFEQWHLFFRKDTHKYWSQISIQFLLDALDGFIKRVPVEMRDTDKELLVVSHAICLSLFDIAAHSFSPDDAASIFVFSMKHRYRSTILSLLKLVEEQFRAMTEETKQMYRGCFVNFCPLLFFLCDQTCQEEIIRIFSQEQNFKDSVSMFLMILRDILSEGKRLLASDHNEYNLRKESVSESLNYLLVSLCGMAVNSSERTFPALCRINRLSSAFHFFCSFYVAMNLDEETQKQYSSFVAHVTADIANHIYLSENLTHLSTLFITFYAVFVHSAMIPMMAAILYRDSQWYHLAVDFMHLFQHLFKVDLHSQIVQLMINTIAFLISYQSNKTRVVFLLEFLNEIMFRRNYDESISEGEIPDHSFEDFLNLLCQTENDVSTSYVIGINKESLDKSNLSKMLLQLALTIVSEDPKAIPDHILSILLYCCTISRTTGLKAIGVFITRILQNCPHVACQPIQCNISHGCYEVPESFVRDVLKVTDTVPNMAMFAKTTQILDDYYASNNPGESQVSDVVSWLKCFAEERRTLSFVRQIYTYDQADNQVDQMAWTRLYSKLLNERCGFFTRNLDNVTRHYKRGSYFDYKYRPILLTPVKIDVPQITPIQDTEMRCLWTAVCHQTTITKVRDGKFYVLPKAYMFVSNKGRILDIDSETVTHLIWRWELMVPNSVEIYTSARKSYLFTFPQETSHAFISNLTRAKMNCHVFVQKRSPASEFQQQKFTEQWLNYSISTYEYVMLLNMFSGRSFHNAAAYPVFPWILTDYQNKYFDPEKLEFRNMEKPIGALNPHTLERAKLRNASVDGERTFLYQTGYSNAVIISHYLVRLEPFSSLHIRLQDGHFDNTNRLFQSISQSFSRLIESGSSFRELTPEFFFCPEFLMNIEHLDFGKNTEGKDISDVELPEWAVSPVDFIQKHAEALESDTCGAMIAKWIDLVFGFRQTGDAANEADNTFDPLMYATGYDPSDQRREYVLKLVGQIPFQLFTEPHPSRNPYHSPIDGIEPVSFPRHPSPVSAFLAVIQSSDDIRIYTIHTDGKCYLSNSKRTQMIYDNFPTDQLLVSSHGEDMSCVTNDAFFVFNPITKKMVYCSQTMNVAAISCISSSRHYIVTGSGDSMLALWKKGKQNISLESQSGVHDEIITCTAISEEYGIMVSCSGNKKMAVFRIPSLDLVRFIDLPLPDNMSPTRVVIQKGMGYISVFCEMDSTIVNPTKKTMVLNYTINGILICSVVFNKVFFDIIPVTDHRSVDHLLVLDNTSTVSLLNGFSLAEERTIYQSTNSVGHIHHCGHHVIISPTSPDSSFILLPFTPG